MSVSYLFKRSVFLAVGILLVPAALCMAEVSTGRIKSVAAGAGVLTLDLDKGEILLVNWDKGTRWEHLTAPAQLRSGDLLTIDINRTGDQLRASQITRVVPAVPAGVALAPLTEIAGPLDRPGTHPPFTLIDVRPADRYEAAHLPGARTVPLRRIEKRSAGILPEERGARLVFYDEGAGDSTAYRAAELAMKAGYTDVAVFPEGAIGWERSGRFLASSNGFLRKGKGAVIDLRDPQRVAAGHIEHAISIPATDLKGRLEQIPLQRWVPIVVYGETDEEALAAARAIRDRGYRRVTIYAGGVQTWLESAEVLSTEKPDGSIQVAIDNKKGALGPSDFELALNSPQTVEIVDVRSEKERRTGQFPQSKAIPLGELSRRHGELNRGKILVVFGGDAEEAEMAVDFLAGKNYRINYLAGRVEFLKDGTHRVK